ncbi:hypothetical protein Pfo_024633 [Paulownia fortunei]|nr:hypothetical protein Pfo_024633 [Paulownia fortunei]
MTKKPADTKPDKTPNTTAVVKAPWLNLFKDNRKISQGIKLSVVETIEDDDVILESQDLDDVEKAWGFCLVGYFAARFLNKITLVQLCDSWKVQYKYFVHISEWLIFKFKNAIDRDSVLNGGPYFVFGRSLLMKMIPSCFDFDEDDISIMPTWINLPCLPLKCWNEKALSKIVSRVGKQLYTDKLTSTKKRLSYARVLIEVDAAKKLTHSIRIQLPNGQTREQPVVYEYEPKFCTSCRMFEHPTDRCKASQQKTKQKGATNQSFKNVEVRRSTANMDTVNHQTATQVDTGNDPSNNTTSAPGTSDNVDHMESKVRQQNQAQVANEGAFTEITNKKSKRNGQMIYVDHNKHNLNTLKPKSSKEVLRIRTREADNEVPNQTANTDHKLKSSTKIQPLPNTKDKRRVTPLPISS